MTAAPKFVISEYLAAEAWRTAKRALDEQARVEADEAKRIFAEAANEASSAMAAEVARAREIERTAYEVYAAATAEPKAQLDAALLDISRRRTAAVKALPR